MKKERIDGSRNMFISYSLSQILESWFKFIITGSQFEVGADLIVYLKTSPEAVLG